jgi:hypothetical protein
MAPIDDAIAAIEACDHEERFVLQEHADRYGVVRSTLSRRLARQTSSVSAKATGQLKLHPHHEAAPVGYIGDLTKQ